jgi:peptidyl-tRNA hydrolase, PTH1 family
MKLIVGLGNPGLFYAHSRHNIGFQVIKELAKIHKVRLARDKASCSLAGKSKFGHSDVVLALPQTFMNLSGKAVTVLLKKYKIDSEDLLVVCDDLDLEFGRVRIRKSGSAGGHNGLKSIIESLSSQEFARLRLGIGRPPAGIEASDFVLMPFGAKERKSLKGIISKAVNCCELWVEAGITESMNIFNKNES